jgi:hypothetical protein
MSALMDSRPSHIASTRRPSRTAPRRFLGQLLLACLTAFPVLGSPNVRAQEELPAPGPVLDPNQAGNIDRGAGERLDLDAPAGPGTVLDPNQVGNIDIRLEQSPNRLDGGQ